MSLWSPRKGVCDDPKAGGEASQAKGLKAGPCGRLNPEGQSGEASVQTDDGEAVLRGGSPSQERHQDYNWGEGQGVGFV